MCKRQPLAFLFITVLIFFLSCAPALMNKQAEKEKTDEYLSFHHFVKGEWYQLQGELDSAISEYHKALKADPQKEEIRLALAKAHYKKEEFEKAMGEPFISIRVELPVEFKDLRTEFLRLETNEEFHEEVKDLIKKRLVLEKRFRQGKGDS